MSDSSLRATSGETDKTGSLNFKVDPDFKKAFKTYAASQDLTMVELLKEGFHLSKKSREE